MNRGYRSHRIGVDLDGPSELQLLKTFLNAKEISKTVDIRRTGHGFHIRIFRRCNSIKKNLEVRRSLSDDPNRIAFDESRSFNPMLWDWVDTLFRIKTKDEKTTCEESYNPLALPFNDRFPAKKMVSENPSNGRKNDEKP